MARRLASCLALLAAVALSQPAFSFDPGGDPYADLNNAAREAYASAKAQILPPDQPVFIVTDQLTLMKDEHIWTEPITPILYRDLKSLSHIPLGIFAAATARQQSPNDPEWSKRLAGLRDHARAALLTLDQRGFSGVQRARQHDLLNQSIAYVDQVLEEHKPDPSALHDYARLVAPATLANAADAAKAQLHELHRAVTTLRNRLVPGDWEQAYVLVLGPKTPRVGNLQYEYFVHAMGHDAADKRLIYAESIFNQEIALGLLRTLLIDRKVGEAFYGNPNRMERDLLADGATAELLQMFGKLGR